MSLEDKINDIKVDEPDRMACDEMKIEMKKLSERIRILEEKIQTQKG